MQPIIFYTLLYFPTYIYSYPGQATYEPELFPGLIYRLQDPKIVILIFVSGKLVLTGAKHELSLTTALETIFPILEEFRKMNTLALPR